MATKWRMAPSLVSGIHRQERKSWLVEDEEQFWAYVCPWTIAPGRVFAPLHGHDQLIESEALFAGFAEFVLAKVFLDQRSGRITTLDQAVARYLDLVKDIPEVREVWLSEDSDGAMLWTVIDADRFDRGPRSKANFAQYEVMRSMDKPLLDFRLLRSSELQGDRRDHFLPRNRRVVLEK